MFALRVHACASVMDAFLTALSDEPFRMGATFAVLFTALLIVGAFLLNKWRGWWVSAELLAAETKRADSLAASTATQLAAMQSDLNRRIDQLREDHDQEFDRQADTLKAVIAAKEQDIEFLRTAWHLADQANREDDASDRREIRAMLTVANRFFAEFQRQTGVPQLPAKVNSDGGSV